LEVDPDEGRPPQGTKSDGGKLSVFVFVDALGWEIVQRSTFLSKLAPYRGPLDTVLGYSCACDPTILTGRLPREHGHFSFFRYAPNESPFGFFRTMGWLPQSLSARWKVRRLLSRLARKALGYTGYFELYHVPLGYLPLLDYTEKRDLYQPGGINSGAKTVFDLFRSADIPFHVSDWRQSDAVNVADANRAIGTGRPRAVYLYLAGLDGVLHAGGTGSPDAVRTLREYESWLQLLMRRAEEKYADVSLHVFSDHGMTDVKELCDVVSRVEETGLRYGKDFAAVYDSTLARFWFLNDAARVAVRALLEERSDGRILSERELKELGCDFPDSRYGELMFLANPGVLICPSHMGRRPVAGMHGYDPADPDSRAAYLTNIPSSAPPRHLTDLFGLMLRDCELTVA
jgi:predicted AlkP superfamily pyrophosphatase or phosphodiesterase